MSLLRDAFERRGASASEARAFQSSVIPSNYEGFGSDSGEYVSDRSALQLIAVQACVRLLADSIAGLPLDAFRKSGDLRQEVSPAPSLVREPFAGLTTFEGMFQTVTSLAMRGESVSVVMARDSLEYATSLLPIHPENWWVDRNRTTGEPVYHVHGQQVPTADVVHVKRFSLPEELHGLSPIASARLGIGIGLAAERYGARWFGQSANPSSVLETEQTLTEPQVQETQRSWLASHGGTRYPAVLSGGFKWKQISITPEESQFLETRRFQRSEIAMLFGVPPHMIGDTEKSTSWGTGIEQQSIGFVTYTLRPWLTCIEQAWSALLPRGQFVRFNVSALLRGDTKARYDSYTQARNAGWLNVDEIREIEDRPPIPDGSGQSYIQPLNMGPLGSDPLAAKEPSSDPT